MQAPSHLPTPIDDGACDHLPGRGAIAFAAVNRQARDRSYQARRGMNGRLLLFNDGRTRSAVAGGMGLDPRSARLHTASLRLPRPLPGTRHV